MKEINKLESSGEITKEDFKIIDELGQGSFGKVYLVEKDGVKYALKEVNKDFII